MVSQNSNANTFRKKKNTHVVLAGVVPAAPETSTLLTRTFDSVVAVPDRVSPAPTVNLREWLGAQVVSK